MEDQFAELREEVLKVAKRKLESIEEVDDEKIQFTFKTGGHLMDAQQERVIKLLTFRITMKQAIFKYI